MELSSFTIEFPQHIEETKRDYWLEWMREKGAEVELLTSTTYRINCHRARQLEYVGWALYHTALAKICNVLGVEGSAEARASAYTQPSPKA